MKQQPIFRDPSGKLEVKNSVREPQSGGPTSQRLVGGTEPGAECL